MKKKDDEDKVALWEINDPDINLCAICDEPVGEDRVIEERPTGPHYKIQSWAYHPECWRRHLKICGTPIPIEKLIDLISGERAFIGPRRSRRVHA